MKIPGEVFDSITPVEISVFSRNNALFSDCAIRNKTFDVTPPKLTRLNLGMSIKSKIIENVGKMVLRHDYCHKKETGLLIGLTGEQVLVTSVDDLKNMTVTDLKKESDGRIGGICKELFEEDCGKVVVADLDFFGDSVVVLTSKGVFRTGKDGIVKISKYD